MSGDSTKNKKEDGGALSVSHVECVNLGRSPHPISTGVGFLDHMIDQLNSHAQVGVSATVRRSDDENVDEANRHAGDAASQLELVSAVGRALGAKLRDVLDRANPRRPSRFRCPLDESLVECVLERRRPNEVVVALAPYGDFPPGRGRTFVGSLFVAPHVEVFFRELGTAAGLSVRLTKLRGRNGHHVVESAFKAFSRALRNLLDGADVDDDAYVHLWGEATATARREASTERATKETKIRTALSLDHDHDDDDRGEHGVSVRTGSVVLDDLLANLADAAGFVRYDVFCDGDRHVDDHHSAEDVAIASGRVLAAALGDRSGLNRMWSGTDRFVCPRPGGRGRVRRRVEVTVDLSNRPCFVSDLDFRDATKETVVGTDGEHLSLEMVDHVLESFATNGAMTVHVVVADEEDVDADAERETEHDQDDEENESLRASINATARAFGRALRGCVAVDPRRKGKTASSKGTLSA